VIAFLIPGAVILLIIAAGMAVLFRRDRRRVESSVETMRIESAATRGVREARRRAHTYHNRFLRERD
jgi:hypothetical protein